MDKDKNIKPAEDAIEELDNDKLDEVSGGVHVNTEMENTIIYRNPDLLGK